MIVRLAADAMGTRFELVLDGADEFFLRAAGESAIEEIREQHDRLNAFNPQSLIGRVNTRAEREPVGVDRELFELLVLCRRVWLESDGAFDPSLGILMRQWGFRGGSGRNDEPMSVSGFDAVELDERAETVRFHGPDIAFDLGGVAKGWALDRAALVLREAGVTCALIHGGTSTAVALDPPPGRGAWGVEIPSHREDVGLLDCRLENAALAVSSPLGRTVVADGRTLGHVLDPRMGCPATGTLVAAVVCESAAVSDAWSTAIVARSARFATMPEAMIWASIPETGGAWTTNPSDQTVLECRE
jgi:FAD:protein FMN transferase